MKYFKQTHIHRKFDKSSIATINSVANLIQNIYLYPYQIENEWYYYSHYLKLKVFTLGIEEKMKKILHILLISCFSFTIISCAEINSSMDDISNKYDEFSI